MPVYVYRRPNDRKTPLEIYLRYRRDSMSLALTLKEARALQQILNEQIQEVENAARKADRPE